MAVVAQGLPVAEAPLGRRRVLVAFSGLVLVMLLAALDSTIVSTALPAGPGAVVRQFSRLRSPGWPIVMCSENTSHGLSIGRVSRSVR